MNPSRLYSVLLSPHISEKSTFLGDKNNQYLFKVAKEATKPQIKKAVATIFNVKVISVTISISKGKAKKFKNISGMQSDTKKAIVRLAKEDSIKLTGE